MEDARNENAAGGPAAHQGLARLEEQVAKVEAAMLDAEVAVETLRVELDNLAHAHHRRLGPLYRRLDELDALIAEATAARSGAADDVRLAVEARGRLDADLLRELDELEGRLGPAAAPSPEEDGAQTPRRVRPGREAQRLYRELARRVHPDLVRDGASKERRSAFLARVNEAYAAGDESALLALADEWMADPESAPPAEAVEDRAGWLLGRLERMQARITALTEEHARLDAGPMAGLLRLAPDDPDGLLEMLAEQLLGEVAEKEQQLAVVLG
ncbi:hypothetical protein BIV57_06975 [Mangrovactinospora gilvigrisea]|uniref:Molecular chaperone DnaJ n=1 Tax=Mangrovactinospora gilvigrisea TaxID=1428644 RepID=A0A1J7BHL5_9ACTN|nr:hypothetical protein [Mangrovactinospora gilvigrisea]OIV38183.1 hypothetical protein BIV57_06975 [Mangrovactinospora gilvigrisea]